MTIRDVKVRADDVRRRIYIHVLGAPSADQVRDVHGQICALADRLGPGFDLVNDMTQATTLGPDAAKAVGEVQRALQARQAGRIARVVPTTVLNMQLNRLKRETGAAYEHVTVSSVAEADRLLDGMRDAA